MFRSVNNCSVRFLILVAVAMLLLIPHSGTLLSPGTIEPDTMDIPPLNENEKMSEDDIGSVRGETTRNQISFTAGDVIDTNRTTAIVEGGVATLSHTPAPDEGVSKSDELLLSWLTDPVHTYKFYPNAMAYDSERHVMVLSLQGVKYLYTIDLADGSKKDDIPTADDNHTGVGCEGNFYYYSIGDGYSSSQDLYRYNKAAFDNPTSGVGEGTSSKDGYPLTIMDNHIYRGKPYEDGTEDWGKIDTIEKVSVADTDEVLATYPLDFSGVADITSDGEYLWLLKETERAVTIYLYDSEGKMVGEFPEIYVTPKTLKPCGLAYAKGKLYVLLYEKENTTEISSLLEIDIINHYSNKDHIYSKTFAQSEGIITSVKIDPDVVIPVGTSIDYYISPDGGSTWNVIEKDEWLPVGGTTTNLMYKIEMGSTKPLLTPTINDLKIEWKIAKAPQPLSPIGGVWIKGPEVEVSWNFIGSDALDAQTQFEVQVSSNSSFIIPFRDTKPRESAESSFSFTGALDFPDGTYYWRVRTMDSYGGWSPFSDPPRQFNVDSKMPTGSMMINGGNSTTPDLRVKLNISADDSSGSGVRLIYISDIGENPGKESHWTPYVPVKDWILSSGEGEKILYVWFKDGVGLQSKRYETTIVYEKIVEEDKGKFGWGKIGSFDVFYVVVIAALLMLLVIAIIILKRGGDDYYDDDDDYYDDDDDDDEELDVLEQIRRKRKTEMDAKLETEEDEDEDEKSEKEEFETQARGRYIGASLDDDFSLESSRYGAKDELDDDDIEVQSQGPYSVASEDDDFALDRPRYGGPPSLDDFMKNIEDMDKEPDPSDEDEKEIGMSEEEVKKAREQIELLRTRRMGILDAIREEKDPRKQTALEQQMDEIQQLIAELRKHMPPEKEEEEVLLDVVEEEPPPPPEKVVAMSVPSDIEEKLKGGRKGDRKRVGGLGFLDKKEEEERSTVSPEVQARLQQILQQLRVLQQQQMAVQNQMRQTADPGQQKILNQQVTVLSQQQQALQQEAQRLQQQLSSQKGTPAQEEKPVDIKARAAQILQQLQALQQRQMAIQQQLAQTQDPGQKQALTQQYQMAQKQAEALKLEAAALQKNAGEGGKPAPSGEAPPPAQPQASKISPEVEAKLKQIIQQLQALQQQQLAIQQQIAQTQDPGQKQALAQQYQVAQQQAQVLKQQAEGLQKQAQSGGAPAPAALAPPPAQPQAAKPSPEVEAKLKQILQQLQALMQQQAAIQQQMAQTQDPGQKQALTQQYQVAQQQAQVLKQQAEALQKQTGALQKQAQTPTSPEIQSQYQNMMQQPQLIQQFKAVQQQAMAIQQQMAQTQDPGQKQALMQQYQVLQQQQAALQQQLQKSQ